MTDSSSESLFEKMQANFALVAKLGLPRFEGEYWSALLAEGRQDYGGKSGMLERDDLWSNFRNNVITKGLDNANVPEEARSRIDAKLAAMYRQLSERVPHDLHRFFEESPIGNPHVCEIDGVRVSQSSLEYTYMLSHLAPHLDDVAVAGDIGGGYGGLARLIKLAFPRIRLVLFDLPEINAIQTYFLAKEFPEATVLGLTDVVDRDILDPASLEFDFLILPGQLFDRFVPHSFGAVINTRSMMEMDQATVDFYIGQIQKKLGNGGVFYCVNRYAKKTRLKDYPFDDRWRVSLSEPWPRFIDENPHHELVALRSESPAMPGLREHVESFPPREGFVGRILTAVKGTLR